MPLPEYGGTLGLKRAAHLLRRSTFGPTKQQIDFFATLTPAQAITQLYGQALPDPVLPIDPETGTEWVLTGITDANSGDQDLQDFFKQWFAGQMLSAGISPAISLAYSARERLVFFLHSHFTAIQSKIDNSRALYFQNQLYRLYALDGIPSATIPADKLNFKELTKKVSVDNAMLRLLDGNLNVEGSVNENYARELLELYSIGRGLEGTLPPTPEQGDYFVYKEQDVQAAAKVLTGWNFDDDFINIDMDTNLPRGIVRGSATNASAHDNEVKTFSDRFLSQTIGPDPLLLNGASPTEASALDEISQLIDLIYSQPETARNICRKIYRFFVYHAITPDINSTIIQEMANVFTSGGFKIQPVIENLLKSQHFYEAAVGVNDDNFGGIIKSPIDLVVGTLRFFNVAVPDVTSVAPFYELTGEGLGYADSMGMNFYEPYDVAGYEAYHQYPFYNRSWISVNYLTRRYEFIRRLVNPDEPGMVKVDVLAFVQNNIPNATASNAQSLVIELATYLLPVTDNLTFTDGADDNSGLTSERLNYFLKTFLSDFDPNPEAAWTDRWSTQTGLDTVRGQLQNLFNAMLQSPEYQLL